jgi:hypothetical protein
MKELYSFTVNLEDTLIKKIEVEKEVEIEKEIEVEKERKNAETGETEKYTEVETRKSKEKQIVEEEREVTEEVPYKIFLKKPTRSQLEEGDMFYSIWLNKFIKMGLLTRSMLAKQHIELGGTLNEDEKGKYSRLYVQLYERQQTVQRLGLINDSEMTNEQKERLEKAVSDLAVIRKELTDFETVQAAMFEHTADIKARNKTITWYLLNLAHYSKDEEGSEVRPLFDGEDFEEKYLSYQQKDEQEDEIYLKSIDKLSSIATIWYMSGVQQQEDFDTLLEEVEREL